MIVLPRLYAILDIDLTARLGILPVDLADAWLGAGVRLLQLRAKNLTSGPMLELADAINERCRAAGAMFVVNDRADIARLCGADGVHVGQADLAPADVRRVVGQAMAVGASTHTDEQVRAAIDAPVSYIAIGPVFATSSKMNPDAVVGVDAVSRARDLAEPRGLPVVAIGGITLDHAPAVIAAGASAVAVISDLIGENPGTRARSYLRALR